MEELDNQKEGNIPEPPELPYIRITLFILIIVGVIVVLMNYIC